MLSILFIGDIVGAIGRATVAQLLPELKKEYSPDLVIANGENIAHGKGVTIATVNELLEAGVNWISLGDHAFDNPKEIETCVAQNLPVIRPANFKKNATGQGYAIIPTPKGEVLLINLLGQVFMNRHFDSPFETWSEIESLFTDKKFSAIIIDIHAEATAEKVAFRHFIDGKISALLGTHTHIQTADAQISVAHTGYITDVGMTGYADGVIGVAKEPILATFLTNIRYPHQLPEVGNSVLNGIHLLIDPESCQCLKITPIQQSTTIS